MRSQKLAFSKKRLSQTVGVTESGMFTNSKRSTIQVLFKSRHPQANYRRDLTDTVCVKLSADCNE